MFTNALSWLSTYGFVLNNRELASLTWLSIAIVWALLKPNIRSALVCVLRSAFARKLILVWSCYIIWIALFIYVADYVGIWQATLTKDTLVWSATTGIVVLGGFTGATKPGYFRREFFKILNVVVIFEYLVNLATFSLLIEIILQPTIFLFIVVPTVAEELEQQRILRWARNWFIAIIAVVMIGYTIRTLSATWQIINWEVLALQMMWPVLLGIWVLVLVFPLAVVATYEEAFIRLRMYRDERKGLWNAKLGLMLALRFRLRWIREAAKGGTKHVANAESVQTAYEAAKRYKTELAKQQEAAN